MSDKPMGKSKNASLTPYVPEDMLANLKEASAGIEEASVRKTISSRTSKTQLFPSRALSIRPSTTRIDSPEYFFSP